MPRGAKNSTSRATPLVAVKNTAAIDHLDTLYRKQCWMEVTVLITIPSQIPKIVFNCWSSFELLTWFFRHPLLP